LQRLLLVDQEVLVIKKYHIADILTASRFFFAALIIAMTIMGSRPGGVLLIFAIGEMTDAVDGPAAARWPYPDELEASLWWRVNVVAFDIAADMVLGTAALIYTAVHTYSFGMVLMVGALSIGTVTQLLIVYVLPPSEKSLFTKYLILTRRAFLYVPTIAAVVIMLLLKATVPGELSWAAAFSSTAFKAWLGFGLSLWAVLSYLKWDRIVGVARNMKKAQKTLDKG